MINQTNDWETSNQQMNKSWQCKVKSFLGCIAVDDTLQGWEKRPGLTLPWLKVCCILPKSTLFCKLRKDVYLWVGFGFKFPSSFLCLVLANSSLFENLDWVLYTEEKVWFYPPQLIFVLKFPVFYLVENTKVVYVSGACCLALPSPAQV